MTEMITCYGDMWFNEDEIVDEAEYPRDVKLNLESPERRCQEV